MGFFENLGRKVEEFKRTAEETAAEGTSHACRSCGERFYADHDECPECGAEAVVEMDPAPNDDEPGDRPAANEPGDRPTTDEPVEADPDDVDDRKGSDELDGAGDRQAGGDRDETAE
ncbi:zinc ribbon domain-containing protein [Halovivax sp.]|uniref:zinc ribbon domain-containing protein n=1 Tax=Halovivax sp. TaxID=1935978 RepID=UPI0025C2DCA5|nr:zinc ribbon domain-containing protein [Halovivax sp.]